MQYIGVACMNTYVHTITKYKIISSQVIYLNEAKWVICVDYSVFKILSFNTQQQCGKYAPCLLNKYGFITERKTKELIKVVKQSKNKCINLEIFCSFNIALHGFTCACIAQFVKDSSSQFPHSNSNYTHLRIEYKDESWANMIAL